MSTKDDVTEIPVENGASETGASPAEHSAPSDNSIAGRQNAPWSIQLLAAQRELYSEAKRWRRVRAWSVIVMAMIGVTATILVPELLKVIGPVGAVLGIVQWAISLVERHRSQTAASIQEEFDTSVYPLPWNALLVTKADTEDVIAASSRHKGDRAKLADWYSIPDGISYPLDVVLCQRTNLRWDSVLRRAYAKTIVAGLVALYLVFVGVGIARDFSLAEFVLGLLPSLGALQLGLETVRGHFRHSSAQMDLKRKVEAAWEKARTRPRTVRTSDLRAIQDGIYQLRVAAPPVPDRFYWRKRDQFEREMRLASEQLWEEAQAASPSSRHASAK